MSNTLVMTMRSSRRDEESEAAEVDPLKVANTGELAPGGKKLVSVAGEEVLLTNIAGKYYAIANRCPHMGGSLFEGKLEGTTVTCPRHGSVFDVRTGKLIERGTLLFIKVKVGDTRSYKVSVEGDDILVAID